MTVYVKNHEELFLLEIIKNQRKILFSSHGSTNALDGAIFEPIFCRFAKETAIFGDLFDWLILAYD